MQIELESYRFAVRVMYEAKGDIGRNGSAVRVAGVQVRSLREMPATACWLEGSVRIDGQPGAKLILTNTQSCTVLLTPEFAGDAAQWSGFSSEPVWVAHAADGSRSVELQITLTVRMTNGTALEPGVSAAVNAPLPRIPRVSELYAEPVTLGQEMVVRLNRAAEDFRDTVRWQCGAASGVLAHGTNQTELRWVPAEILAVQYPESETVPVVLTVQTFQGETAIGSGEWTVLCRVPETAVPTVSFRTEDRTGISSAHSGYVQSRSQLRVLTEAAGALGSEIRNIAVRCGDVSGSGADVSFALPESGRVTVSVTVTDSRGRTAQAGGSVEVQPYSVPTAVIRRALRCDSAGNDQPDGGFLLLEFEAAVSPVPENAAVYCAVTQVRGTDQRRTVLLEDYTGQKSVRGSVVLPAGVDNAYDCVILASDSFTTAQSLPYPVSVAFAMLDLCRTTRAIGIGMRANTAGALSIGLDMHLNAHRLTGLADPEEATDAVTKGYLERVLAQLRG